MINGNKGPSVTYEPGPPSDKTATSLESVFLYIVLIEYERRTDVTELLLRIYTRKYLLIISYISRFSVGPVMRKCNAN